MALVPTKFNEGSADICFKYIIQAYVNKVCQYLNESGKQKYNYGNPLWSWGGAVGNSSMLGLNNTIQQSSPVLVGGASWSSIRAGSGKSGFSLATKTNGTLWAWGYNTYGQLGTSDKVHRSSPTKVGSGTTWKLVSNGHYHALSIQTDGTLWAWGHNAFGSLGINDAIHRSDPIKVGAAATWKLIEGCAYYSIATQTDGTLWTWGRNQSGSLGTNDALNRSSPTKIGTGKTWSAISAGDRHAAAIQTNGSLWAWGSNFNGALGINDTINRSSPTRVGAGTTWKLVQTGYYYSIATQTDGTLWSWGYNNYSCLGLGIDSISNRSSPTKVGAATDWSLISSGYAHTTAVKTNGTLWTWGFNGNFGALGLGDIENRSSPTQIGANTNWSLNSSGRYYSLALTQGNVCNN